MFAKGKNKIVWLALLTMLIWGSLSPMVKLGFSAYSVSSTADILMFAGIRFVICGSIICIYSGIKDKSTYTQARRSIVPILLSGVFSIILHHGLTYTGLELTESSKTVLLKQFGTLFYVCFSFLFIKEDKPTVKKIAAAAVGFLGIFVLNIDADGFSFSIGDVLILSASFCTVFSNVICKKMFVKVSPIISTGVAQLSGGLVLLAAGAAMGGHVHFRWDASLLIMVYICASSIVSYCIWFENVKSGELSNLYIIKFSEPVFACIFGALILGENIWKIQYLAAFLLISGSIYVSNAQKTSKRMGAEKPAPVTKQ